MGQILSSIFSIIKKCLSCQDQKVLDYTNKLSSLPISTPELLESLTHKNSSFELHQDAIDICIDIVQESSRDSDSSSPRFLGVEVLEETKNGGSDDKNKDSSLSISTTELLESLIDTNSSFKSHQNLTATCIDIVQESSQDSSASAHVLGVDNLEETKNGGSVDKIKHSSLSISTPELLESLTGTNSGFKSHQNLTATCIDIVQESSQDSSASVHVLGVDNLEETKNGCSVDKNKHSSLPISTPLLESLTGTNSGFKSHQNVTATCIHIVQERSQDSSFAHVLGVDCLEEIKNGGSVDKNKHSSLPISTPLLESLTGTNSGFKSHQNVTATCIHIVQERSQDSSSAHVLGVDCLEETKNGGSVDTNKHSSLLISTPLLKSLAGTNSGFKLRQKVTAKCIDIVRKSSQDPASASVHVLGVNSLEEKRNGGPEKWLRHYCSSYKMLLVGEGDFSFSASLALAFGSAENMVATSLDSKKFLSKNYKKAMSNIHELRSRGCTVLHGVDATKMANHGSLGSIKFDRIIYNFPHTGFRSNEPVETERRRHQLLVSLFFQNAKEMIEENGEIHVTHKSNRFFLAWNLEGLASAVGLGLIQQVPFNYADYPGYGTKYGFGGDKNFDSNPSKTYKFGLVRRRSNQQNVPKRGKGKRVK